MAQSDGRGPDQVTSPRVTRHITCGHCRETAVPGAGGFGLHRKPLRMCEREKKKKKGEREQGSRILPGEGRVTGGDDIEMDVRHRPCFSPWLVANLLSFL